MLMATRSATNLFTDPAELDRRAVIEELLAACREQLRRAKSKAERKDIRSSIRGYEFQLKDLAQ